MGNENSTKKKKKILAATGTSSGLGIGLGVGLMFLGPVGMICGSVLMSAGISGATDTIAQSKSN